MFIITVRASMKVINDMALQQEKKSLPLFLFLIAAGLLGNYFKFTIFLDVDFLFGSIFAMLVLQLFGSVWGILAAAVIASYTWILWNHPYAILITTAEATVVGWLMNRRKMGMVPADALFWLIIGMPLVYLFYHVTMHVPFSNTSIIMSKQAVNGIANALTAQMIFTGLAFLRPRSSLISISEIVYNMLVFFVLTPALILLAISSRADFSETDNHIRTLLMQDSRLVNQYLTTWAANRESAIVNLADIAASKSPEQMQSCLEQAMKSDANFLRIGLLDKDAIVAAYFPLFDELGQKNIGKSFADRPFIPKLKQTLKPMLSEVVMGRIGVPRPMVTMIAPVVIDGSYGGYVTGILSLKQIQAFLDKSNHGNTTFFTLVDKNGNVITTSRADQQVMKPFIRGKGSIIHLDAGISQWVPELPPNTSIMERWKSSFYISETDIGRLAEWKLILEQPIAPFQKKLNDTYSSRLTLLFLILLGVLLVAGLLTHYFIGTFEKLILITHDIPDNLLTDSNDITWPESGVAETDQLIHNFRRMANSLRKQFNDVEQANARLQQAFGEMEMRVHERTDELNKTNAVLIKEISDHKKSEDAIRNLNSYNRSLIEASLDPLVTIDLEGKISDANSATEQATGYPRHELTGTEFSDYFTEPEKARTGYQMAFREGVVRDYPLDIRHRNGPITAVLYNATVFHNDSGEISGIFASARDITALKHTEEELKAALQEKEVLLREIHHRVKNNMQVISSLLNLQCDKVENEQERQALFESQQRIIAMSMIHETLYSSQYLSSIDLSVYLKNLVHHLQGVYCANTGINIILELDEVELGLEQAVPCGLIINELVTNAFKHAFPGDSKGTIKIRLHPSDEREVILEVIDDGVGFASDPDPENSSSLGLILVTGLLKHQLKGSLNVSNEGGAAFTIRWPLPEKKGEVA